MIHIVSGFRRSGTSMMMKSLIEGGMDALYDPARDEQISLRDDERWKVQHGAGLFEPGRKNFNESNFPNNHDGKLIKVLFGGLARLTPHSPGVRYLLMLRHPEEIRQSDEALFQRTTRTPDWIRSVETYNERVTLLIGHLQNRRDTLSVTTLQMREVVADPPAAFATLISDGWVIPDTKAAEAVPDDSYVRFKIEDLEVGI